MERRKIADILFKEGSILSGLEVTAAANVLTLSPGVVYIDGHIEQVAGAVLTYDPATTSGADYVYVELLKYNYGYTQDAGLINPATGEPTAEREKMGPGLKDHRHHRPDSAQQRHRAKGDPDLQVRPRNR